MSIEYDDLTGALTFKAFIEQAQSIILANQLTGYTILSIDVERFKIVNDFFGMEVGDNVLKKLVQTSKKLLGSSTIIGRVGGDKFVCLVDTDDFDVEYIKNHMDFNIETESENYTVGLKVGVYEVIDRTLPIIKMCDRALLALDSVKDNRVDKVAVYSEDKREQLVLQEHIISDLDRGIANREFFVVIQPIYDVKNNVLAAGEVLVRWNHPKLGYLPPNYFIPVLENSNLITKLDLYVWEEACRIIKRMRQYGGKIVPLSINVSRTNLNFLDLSDTLCRLVEKYNIPIDALRVEITESAYIDNPGRLVNTVVELKKRGFIVLMDDFGTGYSSMSLLKDMSFDILKIDKTLIDEVENSDKAGNLVSSIIQMSKWLGMSVVSEGVENGSQAAFLKNIGCDYIQGFLYSKPISEDEFIEKCEEEIEDYCDKNFEDIDFANIYNIKNVEVRTFIDAIVGPMALYEYDGNELQILKVNEEYLKFYNVSPRELFRGGYSHFTEAERYSLQQIKECCDKARRSHKSERVVVGRIGMDDAWIWVSVRVRYVGSKDGKARFLFGISDVTKEHSQSGAYSSREFYPLLCHLYNEIMELDYTDNTAMTMYHDEDVYHNIDNEDLDAIIKRYAEFVIDKEYRQSFLDAFGKDNITKFFKSGERTFTYEYYILNKEGERVPTETTAIKINDVDDKVKIMACSRVVNR